MKKALVFVLALIMVLAALPVAGASADEVPAINYSEHFTLNSDTGYDYDITGSSIAWVKQANGTLIWVAEDDARSDAEIIDQAKKADPSLKDENAVLRGFGTAKTPNSNGSQATVTVYAADGKTILSIDGKYSHCVMALAQDAEPAEPEQPEVPAEEGEKANLRIDAPLKMAVAFEDGTVYYGGEMKEVIVGKEYAFQMCSVNWENGVYDENGNGITGTVVYRMIAVHQDEFNAIADKAKGDPERFTVKGIDVIDNKDKMIFVDIDAEDAHLETDVNNFFMAYRFHFVGEDYNKKTGIAQVINTPVESLSVNLPLGSTITCKAYKGDEEIDTADVLVVNNSGKGVYDDVELTSVNDFTWGEKPVAEEMEYAEAVAEEYIEYAK